MGSELLFEFDPRRFASSFFHVAKAVFLTPTHFFGGMRRRGGFAAPVIFMAACLMVHVLAVGLLRRDWRLAAINLVMGLVFPFLTAAILHLILTRLMRSAGTYEAVLRVNAYAAAVNLLSWFPLFGMLLEFYRLYLLVVGLSAVYAVKKSRALLALLLTLAVYVAAAGIIAHLTGGGWGGGRA